MLQKCNDSELLMHWRQGNQAAFAVLFDRYFNKLLQFTIKRMADQELAEELVMDVLTRLWQHRDTIYIGESLSPYLFHSVKNALIDQLRKNALKTCLLDEEIVIHPVSVSLDDQFNIKDLKQVYIDSLELLSPQRKRVFELSRIEGKSHKEISLELNVSISTVKSHINATLRTLRNSMQQHTDIALTAIVFFYFLK